MIWLNFFFLCWNWWISRAEIESGNRMGGSGGQQYCLRWNNHRSNLLTVFEQLFQSEALTDVTLAVGGTSIKCHKIVLAACSGYFRSLFLDNNCPHPIVVFKDIQYPELRAILEFIYRGEVSVAQEHVGALLKAAESLRVKGEPLPLNRSLLQRCHWHLMDSLIFRSLYGGRQRFRSQRIEFRTDVGGVASGQRIPPPLQRDGGASADAASHHVALFPTDVLIHGRRQRHHPGSPSEADDARDARDAHHASLRPQAVAQQDARGSFPSVFNPPPSHWFGLPLVGGSPTPSLGRPVNLIHRSTILKNSLSKFSCKKLITAIGWGIEARIAPTLPSLIRKVFANAIYGPPGQPRPPFNYSKFPLQIEITINNTNNWGNPKRINKYL